MGRIKRGAVLFIFFQLSGLHHMHFWLLSCLKRKGDRDRRMERSFRAKGSPTGFAQSTDSTALIFVSNKVKVSALIMAQPLCRGKRSTKYCIWWENKAGDANGGAKWRRQSESTLGGGGGLGCGGMMSLAWMGWDLRCPWVLHAGASAQLVAGTGA